MSLKRCCCVSAMRNVRHREIDDVEVRMRSRRRRTCAVKDHTSSKRSLEVVGRPYCQLARDRSWHAQGKVFARGVLAYVCFPTLLKSIGSIRTPVHEERAHYRISFPFGARTSFIRTRQGVSESCKESTRNNECFF